MQNDDALHRRTAALALSLLGILLVGVVVLFTVFDDTSEESAGPAPEATPSRGGSGGTDGAEAGRQRDEPAPIVATGQLAEAHRVMRAYMAGVSTYDHRSSAARWSRPLLEMTTGEKAIEQQTALPSGREWDRCRAVKCSSRGTAEVERDAVLARDVTRNSGTTVSSVVTVEVTVTEDGEKRTEENTWLVSARLRGSEWQISGFDLYGLGNVGSSAQDEG